MHCRLKALFLSLLLVPCIASAAAQKSAGEQIRYYQAKLVKDPTHWPSWAGLGVAYLMKERESYDFAYLGKAEKALKRSLELQPNYDALHYLAAVYVAQHRFAEAIKYGVETVKTLPSDTQSFVFLSDAYLAIGDYDQEADVVQRMFAIKADFYTLSHSARLRFLRGDTEGAIEEMQKALTMAAQDELSQALTHWSRVQLGSYYFSRGDLAAAERAYQQALSGSPDYAPGLEHLAELRVAQQNRPAAIELYERLLSRRQNPAWQSALADIYEQSGDIARARTLRRQAIAGYRRSIRQGRIDYYRHLALLYLEDRLHRTEALALAEQDLKVRHDVYAYDTLAWAQYKNARYQQAAATIQRALRTGTQDAQLFYHAGMIFVRTGNTNKAREYLERALKTNPYFNPTETETARLTLKQIN